MAQKESNNRKNVRRVFAIIRFLISRQYPVTTKDIIKYLEEQDIEVPTERTINRDL